MRVSFQPYYIGAICLEKTDAMRAYSEFRYKISVLGAMEMWTNSWQDVFTILESNERIQSFILELFAHLQYLTEVKSRTDSLIIFNLLGNTFERLLIGEKYDVPKIYIRSILTLSTHTYNC